MDSLKVKTTNLLILVIFFSINIGIFLYLVNFFVEVRMKSVLGNSDLTQDVQTSSISIMQDSATKDSNEGATALDTTPPAVTINSVSTKDSTPRITGTIDDPNALMGITIDGPLGITYYAIITGNTWYVDVFEPLSVGDHDILVSAEDQAGNLNVFERSGLIKILPSPTPIPVKVTSIRPLIGPKEGNTNLIISGEEFKQSSNYTVSFGEFGTLSAVYNNSTQLSVSSPPGSGSVELKVFESGRVLASGYSFIYEGEEEVEASSSFEISLSKEEEEKIRENVREEVKRNIEEEILRVDTDEKRKKRTKLMEDIVSEEVPEILVEEVIDTSPEVNYILILGVLTTSFIPYISFLSTPGILLNTLRLSLSKRRKFKPWGIVVDSSNGQPISFVVCRLFIEGSTHLVDQTLTDENGSYGFLINPGKYRLEILKEGYDKYVENIIIEEEKQVSLKDVKLYKEGSKVDSKIKLKIFKQIQSYLEKFVEFITPIFLVLGLLVSSINIFIEFSIIQVVILITYIVFIAGMIVRKVDLRSRMSSVVDSETGFRVPEVLIKIFDLATGDLVDTTLTNRYGYFDYWGEPGKYAVYASLKGYSFPSKKSKHERIELNGVEMIEIDLKKGKNRIEIKIDQI